MKGKAMTNPYAKLPSWLPPGGENLFQLIKAKRAAAEAKGIPIINMSIGQPVGPAFESARKGASVAIMSERESMHEYQDNGEPGTPGAAKKFVQAHYQMYDGMMISDGHNLGFLPVPGLKSMLGLVILACGHWDGRQIRVATTTEPGYPTPATWCKYLRVPQYALIMNPDNKFLPSIEGIEPGTKLMHFNFPHNPSAAVANRAFWEMTCTFCQEHGIRLFNDAAYAMLNHSQDACMLGEVAVKYPGLSWAEGTSASKVIGNGTGWRYGVIYGSADFVADIANIKGNTDSGHVAAMAAGVMECVDNDFGIIRGYKEIYGIRISVLTGLLSNLGMRLAVTPGAGFFTLWLAPKMAFGIETPNAMTFNDTMIENSGIVGVPFGPYIRYAVVNPIDSPKNIEKIGEAFTKAAISY